MLPYCHTSLMYARCSNEDPGKSGLESKGILHVEGVFVLVHSIVHVLTTASIM